MNITIVQSALVFAALGFPDTDKWSAEKHSKKLTGLAKIVNDPKKIDLAQIDEAEAVELIKKMQAAVTAGETLEIGEDVPAAKPAKPAKAAKTAKPAADESDEDETPAPAAKPAKAAKTAKPAADESDEDEEPAAKPAKAAKTEKSAKPAKSSAKLDKYGYKEGTWISRVLALIGKKPVDMKTIKEQLESPTTQYSIVHKLIEDGHIVEVELDGKACWKLKK